MRIGVDATCWSNHRGFGRFVRELLQAIARLGTDDTYVLFSDRQTAEVAEFPSGWPVVVGDTAEAPAQAAAADSRRSLRDLWVMRRLVQHESLDLFFFPAVYSYFPMGGQVPCLVTFHDVIAETLPHLVFQTRRSRMFWQLKCRLAVRRAARVITVSEASKQGLMRMFGLGEERIRVVSEAASATFGPVDCHSAAHRAALRRHGVQPDDRYLLYVGGISPHKNLDTLIEGFAQIVRSPGYQDVRLVLVGDYRRDVFRTCYEALQQRTVYLAIDNCVHFTGFVVDDDLVHLYAAAQALILPSYLEGFGLPAVEAMACGAAVVASNRGALPEVLHGAGHLFDPHSIATLVNGLRRVLADAPYRAALQAGSLVRARAFSWEQSARRAVEIFHENSIETNYSNPT
jgi:glycosyltransferase involved in cell wall biosynthesis